MSTRNPRDRSTLDVAERALRLVVVGIAALAALCSLVVVVSMASGARPLVFRSGSMSPAIPAGSLAFTRHVDARDLAVGDVVTVKVGSGRVTHRIVAVKHHGDVALLQLKGDANKAADRTIYPVRETQRTWFSVPVAGSVTAWLSRPVGGLSLAAYLLLVVLVVGRWRRTLAPTAVPSAAFARRNRAVAGGTAVLTFAAGAFGSWVMPTWAYWTDDATASSATISTGTWDVAPPASAVTNVTPLVNAAGWYNANITVSLTASDAAPSSGVAGIHYILNGGSEQVLSGSTGNVPITTEGTNTLEFWAVDNAGFIESPHHTATYKLDKTPPPAPVFTKISNDTGASSTDRITSAATQTLSGTAEANSTVTVKQGTSVLGTTSADSSGNFSYGPVTLAPGANGFTATAKDVADNVSPSSAGFVVTLDAVAPNSVVISPNDSLWHNTGVWTVTATDALSGVNTVSYKVGAASFVTVPASNGVAVSPPALADGANSVQAYATDLAGVTTSASPVSATIKVDTVKPTATLNLAPISNSPWRTSGTANVTATDATSGVEHVEYQIDSGSFTSLGSGVGFTIPDGTHTVTYRAVDFAGNVSTNASQSVQIDSAKPTTTVASSQTPNAAGWINANTTLTFSPSDPSPSSGVANVQFQSNVNGAGFGAYTTLAPSPYTTSITTEGTTVVGFHANDVAGNAEAPDKTYTVKLDKTAPGVGSITFGGTLTAGWLNSGSFTISGNDAGAVGVASGVDHYEYSIDGGSFVTGSTGTLSDRTTAHTVQYRTVDTAGNVGAIGTATAKVDSTSPVLSNPLPTSGTTSAAWTSISCATTGTGANQLCVNADDAVSGFGSVKFTLVRVSGSTTTCWNGTSFVSGSACSAQTMSVAAGSQYMSSGLSTSNMLNGSYTATFSATDVAGNTATPLTVTFSLVNATLPTPDPTLSCNSPSSGTDTVAWPAVTGATSYTVTWYDTSNSRKTITTSGLSAQITPVFGPNGGHPVSVVANGPGGATSLPGTVTKC